MTHWRKSKGSQREDAYNGLYRALFFQQLPVGLRLREIEWSKRLGVNRAALREALARLEADGFVQRGESGGYRVPKLEVNDIINIFELRVALEAGAIERICQLKKNTADNLKGVQAACDEFARLMDENDLAALPEVDLRFHGAIIQASGNKRLMKVYSHAPLPLIYPEKCSKNDWMTHTVTTTLVQHRAILAAILKGDAAGARKLLYQHLIVRYTTDIERVPKLIHSVQNAQQSTGTKSKP